MLVDVDETFFIHYSYGLMLASVLICKPNPKHFLFSKPGCQPKLNRDCDDVIAQFIHTYPKIPLIYHTKYNSTHSAENNACIIQNVHTLQVKDLESKTLCYKLLVLCYQLGCIYMITHKVKTAISLNIITI